MTMLPTIDHRRRRIRKIIAHIKLESVKEGEKNGNKLNAKALHTTHVLYDKSGDLIIVNYMLRNCKIYYHNEKVYLG